MSKIEEEEEERQKIIEEKSEKILHLLGLVMPKEYIQSIPTFKKYFIYILISLFIFLLFLFFLCKNILFLRWLKIPNEFKILGFVDRLLKKHLEM